MAERCYGSIGKITVKEGFSDKRMWQKKKIKVQKE